MDTQKFIQWAIKAVVDYFNGHVDVTNRKALTPDDVYVVWSCKTLGNNKALLSTNIPDGMYYEITYNGAKKRGVLRRLQKVGKHEDCISGGRQQ